MCRFLFLLLSFIMTMPLFAQLEVKENSFRKVDGFVNLDLDKQNDHNGKPYSVLKIRTENIDGKQRRELDFKCDSESSFEADYKDGEVWLYISYYVSHLQISHPNFGSTEFWFPYDMKAKCGYELTVVNKTRSKDDVYNYLIIKVKQPEAKVYIDDEFVGENEVNKAFKAGEKHKWRIECEHYMTESGEEVIPSKLNKNVIIIKDLALSAVNVSITTDPTADIYVDDEKKGRGSWTGIIADGAHRLESRKPSHKSGVKEVQLFYGRDESFVLPNPIPIYGSISLDSETGVANIMIDDVYYGTTPNTLDKILIGEHELKLWLDDCDPLVKQICVQDGKTLAVNEKLPVGKTYTVNGQSFEMILVKGGTYLMGKDKKSTTVGDFYIGKFEVTQKLFKAVMGYNSSGSFVCDNCPAGRLSWDKIQKFITKLNQLTGENFRVPTEAEWEFAARGGNKSKGYKYSGGNNPNYVAWHDGNSGGHGMGCNAHAGRAHDVGSKEPNELGIYDMSGNIAEWCQKIGETDVSKGIGRGGDFRESDKGCRITYRSMVDPNNKYLDTNGLRLVKDK